MSLENPAGGRTPTAWLQEPQWYLWDGGFLLLGRSVGVVRAHSHHAIQIVVALDGEAAICAADEIWQSGRGFVAQPDVVHSFDGRGSECAMLFVDPESDEGRWLRSSLSREIDFLPDSRLTRCLAEFRKLGEDQLESNEVSRLVRECVHSLCAGPPPLRRLDPRVRKSIESIRGAEDLRITLDGVAAAVSLSSSRFAHLFSQQVGLPFRRYVLWRKLARAMLAIAQGESMTDAAQAADFADTAHLTRTFNQMFGIAPSALMRGRFAEIPLPFEVDR